ncbi:calmodulin-binding transcription activator 2 [Tachysurus vachellii]|uniref:calmodulin-binding transcription activator 2 n=1 Tax=Tachysurus vachellii TaxID=175792 RepID=UPI00296AE382|nr:calmodulin-binding transcription activator 2 [Tachysurus vachellii]
MNNKDTTTESENNRQMKVFLPNKLLECLPRINTLPKERLRWNTNEEIASYLISFDRHEEWLSFTLKTRPQNGSVILYNRKKVQYRKDGYCWKKRKDGKTTREDHMKLKVQGTECLYGCYVHSSIVPTFHRRCYWLLQNPDIVLVHYLNVPNVEDSGKACGPVLCAVTDRRDGLRWSREELLSQLKPMFHSMKWCGSGHGAEVSIEQLVQQILESQQTKPQPRTHTCLCNHAASGMNIPHRCNSTKHRIISPKLPCGPAPYFTEVQNLTHESSGGGAVSRDGSAGDAVAGAVANEKAHPSSPAVVLDNGSSGPPSSSSSSPPQTQRSATIAIGNGNGFYGDQHGGLATVALPQNAVIVMTTTAAAAALGQGGEESKCELNSGHLSVTHNGGRLLLSPVPTKQDTPPSSPAPVPPNQGVATLSLTLLPSPVIGGLLLTDRIIADKPSAMLRPSSPSPSLMTPPSTQTASVPASTPVVPTPFDPDSFLNSPKQGQTYGGSSLSPPNTTNSASSSQSPPPSSSPQPPSFALTLSPTSPPSSLSSLSPPTSTPNSASLSPSLSYSLSPACPAPSFPPLCLDSSLTLDSLTHPLSPTLDTRVSSPSLEMTPRSSASDGQTLLIGQDGNVPSTLLSVNYTHNQLFPSCHLTLSQQSLSQQSLSQQSLSQQSLSQLTPKALTNQPLADGEGAGRRLQEPMTQTHTDSQDLRQTRRGLCHSLSQTALLTHNDAHRDSLTHADTHTHSHTHKLIAQLSPVQVKEENSPPITLRELECDEIPMDTGHSSDSTTKKHRQEVELSFDSTFPDLISELITEETSSHSACTSLNSAIIPPTYPVRYMAPLQPTPSTSYLPYTLLTQTHTHSSTHSRMGEEPQCLASITDFSPEWSYPEGGVKVLITGPWSEVSCRYSCVFDQSTVPASLIQPGVLRCYCPAHEAGLVALRVMKNSDAVSSSVLFEYRARNAASLPSSQLDWLSLDDNQFRMSILERLEQMERRMSEMVNHSQQQQQQQQQQQLARQQNTSHSSLRLTPENQSGPWFERRIVSVCERMMSGGWWGGGERLTHCIRHRGMTLLHLAAAQGYTHLIHTLIHWRTLSADSLDLEQEVDPLNVDHFSCTPLMWACALGHQSAAVLLYRWSSVALMIPDSLGRLPLAVARSRGHTRLACCLEELHTHTLFQAHTPEITHTHNQSHTLDTSPPPQLPLSPLSTSPDTGLSSSSSIPSPSDLPSPSPSSAYSSGSALPTSPQSPNDPMDTSCDSSPSSSPTPALQCPTPKRMDAHFLLDSSPHSHTHSSFEAELFSYSENAENEEFLPAEVLQVDMATLAEQIIEATPERIKQEEFPKGAESPLRERWDNAAIHDTMPWLAPYLDTVDRCVCPTPQPPSPLSALALQRLRPPSSAAWAEFLNASANGRMERDFALLTLTDSEQRELYEAARIIQNAFRRYKGRRLKEQQDMAAAVIQRCYRKYKQYALYKKMTQAAILIQSKFRSYYEQKKFQQSRRAAVLIQQYYRSYKEYERIKQGGRTGTALSNKMKGSFLTKKQDQAARKIMRFFRRCRHRIKELKQSKELERRGLTT